MKHSWPRRSGKTGAAIMTAMQRGWKYYNCGGSEWTNRQFNGGVSQTLIATTLRGLECAVIDNYEHATNEEKEIIATLNDSEIYGTFGCEAEDYRIVSADKWKLIQEDINNGLISRKLALREFNISNATGEWQETIKGE